MMGHGGACGIPNSVRKVMLLLQWASFPNSRSLEDYRAEAQTYVNLRDRVRRGKAKRDAMRRGP